jgi:hypothetical protein
MIKGFTIVRHFIIIWVKPISMADIFVIVVELYIIGCILEQLITHLVIAIMTTINSVNPK